jgi:hypothetical protein
MIKYLDQIGKVVFGAAIVGVLSFGATQAVAAPSDTMQATRCTSHDLCEQYCVNNGYIYGKCINWVCNCLSSGGQWVPQPGY